MKSQTVRLILALQLFCGKGYAQIASSNPLEYVALAEGNELINGQIKDQISDQQKTALFQNTIAAEFDQIHRWEQKYNSYLKTVDGYASTLKAVQTEVGNRQQSPGHRRHHEYEQPLY